MAGKISFGFTLPQRGVFFGIASWPEMLKLAQDAEHSGASDLCPGTNARDRPAAGRGREDPRYSHPVSG